jgi:serine/threonine-protein kinase
MDLKPGEIVGGKYRIERVLGEGGMGVVVSATHVHLDERVALKFLLPEVLNNPEAVARFGREARAAVKIKSEHVARVTDVGSLESGAPFMVMEFLTGADLSARLRDHGRLEIAEAVELVLQACEALAEAHALGIVHRDLKPANLFLTHRPDGSASIKVLDFGISKATGAGMSMTRTSAVMGSPLYMSPEQMTSARDVDVRTDVWAVGVILYELISGRVPFEGSSLPHLFSVILQQPPPSLVGLRPDVPRELETVIFRCLEKDRNQRFSNIAELAGSLQPFAPETSRRSVERVSRVLGVQPPLAQSRASITGATPVIAGGDTNATWGQTQPAVPMQRNRWFFPVAALVALGGVGAWLWQRSAASDGDPTSASSTAAVTPPSAIAAASIAPLESPQAPPSPLPIAPVGSSSAAHAPPPAVTGRAPAAGRPGRATAHPAVSAAPAPAPPPAAPGPPPPPPPPPAAPAPTRAQPSMEDLIRDRR